MALRNATPLKFSPAGLSDTIDGTNVFEGACARLSNLIPDPSTRNLWQGRPASIQLVNFNSGGGPFSSGFSSGFQSSFTPNTSGFISALDIFGNIAYGMIANALFPGQDAPFAYNLTTRSFIPITGATAANTPASPPTSGPWTPPSIALVGTKVLITHPGFNFGGGFAFGVIDISNPAALTWTAQNLTLLGGGGGVTLPSLPVWVSNFNGRAYFLCNPIGAPPAAIFSDILAGTQFTFTTYQNAITFEDDELLTCAGGLGLYSQLGGIVQALIVFKNIANIYQITGDPALGTLARNSLNVATGTLSALSVTSTSRGLTFLAPDGLRLIDFTAKVSDPLGVDGAGVNTPFVFSVEPSRVQAASNQAVLRISVQNGNAVGALNEEYWYDIARQKWSGPHTFPASQIAAYKNTFIIAPIGVLASLWQSDIVQSSTSTFVENGKQMSFTWASAMLPDPGQMFEFAMVETTLNMAMVAGQFPVNVQALNQDAAVLNSVLITIPGTPSIWGQFTWGQGVWGGAQSALFPRPLDWTKPVEFRRLQIQATGNLILGFKIGDLFLRYQKLGYLTVRAAS